MTGDSDARGTGLEWERRAAERRRGGDVSRPALAAPRGVTLREGRGQVTIDWEPVAGAAGYLVRRAASPDGEYAPLEIGEPWVRPVPHPPLTDTTGTPGQPVWYTVAAVAAVDDDQQPASQPLTATPAPAGDATCRIGVEAGANGVPLHRPWARMIGAERLSQLDHGQGPGGRHVGDEFAEALRRAHDELGIRAVRAHAILHDDLGVYRELDGEVSVDFTGVDRIYDRVLELGLRPVVEISFMPRDLARDPDATVFHYGAIVSPPRDWERWARLVGELADHLVRRYGRDEVSTWGFEVWNEANLEVFWSGTRDEYLRLYDVTARAVKAVDSGLRVGGPASAAAAWIDELLAGVDHLGSPIDFLSTHTYGNAPLDLRPIAARHGRLELQLWWTEWGAHATHFDRVHDTVWSAAYLVRGMVSSMDRLDALAYWTISDHFEELGRPSELLHGGFGLLGLGNLPKPRWWAQWMLAQLPDQRLPVGLDGDGAGDLVGAVAARDDASGAVAVVVWNGTVDSGKNELAADGHRHLLDRHVDLVVDGLPERLFRLRHRRLDEHRSNLNAAWAARARGRAWPDHGEWEQLAAESALADLEPPRTVQAEGGAVHVSFALPMPAVSLLELVPVRAP